MRQLNLNKKENNLIVSTRSSKNIRGISADNNKKTPKGSDTFNNLVSQTNRSSDFINKIGFNLRSNKIDKMTSQSPQRKFDPHINYLIPAQDIFKHKFNKKTLILDLDETLIHSSFTHFNQDPDIILKIEIENKINEIHVLKRPGVDEFLKQMSNFYEIGIFTASLSNYADPLIDVIDKDKVCSFRLFRESCSIVNGFYVKELKRLNRNLKNNNPASYSMDTENGLPIKSFYDDKTDNQLNLIGQFLEKLASVEDVREYIKKVVYLNQVNYDRVREIFNGEKQKFKEKEKEKNKLHNDRYRNEELDSQMKINKNFNQSNAIEVSRPLKIVSVEWNKNKPNTYNSSNSTASIHYFKNESSRITKTNKILDDPHKLIVNDKIKQIKSGKNTINSYNNNKIHQSANKTGTNKNIIVNLTIEDKTTNNSEHNIETNNTKYVKKSFSANKKKTTSNKRKNSSETTNTSNPSITNTILQKIFPNKHSKHTNNLRNSSSSNEFKRTSLSIRNKTKSDDYLSLKKKKDLKTSISPHKNLDLQINGINTTRNNKTPFVKKYIEMSSINTNLNSITPNKNYAHLDKSDIKNDFESLKSKLVYFYFRKDQDQIRKKKDSNNKLSSLANFKNDSKNHLSISPNKLQYCDSKKSNHDLKSNHPSNTKYIKIVNIISTNKKVNKIK